MRNASSTHFTFRKNHFSGFIQRRLDYIFISNSVQAPIQNIDVLPSFCSDHSSLLLSYKKLSHSNLRKDFCKFNCSLIHNELYVLKMKKYIKNIISSFNSDFNHQMKWKCLKYEIRKFAISFSKNKTKSMREKLHLKKKLFGGKLNCREAKDEYNLCKENINVIYYEIANELGKKSNRFFFNLEKY